MSCCASCAVLVVDLERYADALEGLVRVFTATTGERAEVLAYVYADCAGGVRRLIDGHRHRRAGALT